MAVSAVTGVYVYGLTWSGRSTGGRGIGDNDVATVEHGELAAIISAVSGAPLRAKRRDLLRHSAVLQDAFAAAPVVPLRFGTVLETERDVEDLLASRYEELVGLLQRVEGLAELRVRAAFSEPDILAEVVRDDRGIAALRDATRDTFAGDPRLVELGEAVARAVAAKRAAAADEIVSLFSSRAVEVRVEDQREELEVLRASFLVERRAVPALERAAEDFARRHAARLRLDLVGPMPPHSFVSLNATRGS
ncbi:MAG: GvpL/GvpF family gas vesicle protein [Gaiellaceae bacterium]